MVTINRKLTWIGSSKHLIDSAIKEVLDKVDISHKITTHGMTEAEMVETVGTEEMNTIQTQESSCLQVGLEEILMQQ